MNKAKANAFKRELTDELRSLARVLEDLGIIADTGPLKHAADTFRLTQESSEYFWYYEFKDLRFGPISIKENRIKHSRPRNLDNITIYITVELKGKCLEKDELENPFDELTVGIEIFGETEDGKLLSSAWHLDRHPDPSGGEEQKIDEDEEIDEDSDKESPFFAHPIYHFHCGGKKVWDKTDAEFGSHLLLEGPRVAHPPLDAILAVDFILSNYLGKQWKSLRNDSTIYNDLLKNAQTRYWQPYAIAAASHWNKYPLPKMWSAALIWPQLF